MKEVAASVLGATAAEVTVVEHEGEPIAIGAMIGLVGGGTNMRIGLGSTASGAKSLTRAMLMMEDDEPVADPDVDDAIGELANMVGGGVKIRIDSSLSLGLPEVIKGSALASDPATRLLTVLLNQEPTPLAVVVLTGDGCQDLEEKAA